MTSSNHTHSRELQQDARAWADFTGTKYTAALRQISDPLAQGLLGEQISARHLIATLDDHHLIGSRRGSPALGENGCSATTWKFDGETDFIELALIMDMLRMFSPSQPEISSYSLKHTAEKFLRPHLTYVSNGRLIWAAAALGLRMAVPERPGLNLLIGVSEREYNYVGRMIGNGSGQPRAHHYRPAGYAHLRAVLAQAAEGEPISGRWHRPTAVSEPAPFHDWLMAQADRNDVVGDLASDYSRSVRNSDHRVARTPDDLLAILHRVPHAPEAYDAAVDTIAEWMRTTPSPTPIRTARISNSVYDHEGWGAGGGTTERYEHLCPCGDGTIVEEHDNIPGFRDHDVRIICEKCRAEWRFVGQSVRGWGLEPVAVATAN